MCLQLQYVFTQCFNGRQNCTGRIKPVTVKLCEQAIAQGGPPWEEGYTDVGREEEVCIPEIEFRYIYGKCYECSEERPDADGLLQRYDPRSPDNNVFHTANQEQDDFTWHVEQTPWTDPLFREVNWTPDPRIVPLDPPLASPGDSTEYIHPPTGVQDAFYAPEYWRPADGRPVRLLETPNDPPNSRLSRPAKPELPANPELPEDFDEQLDELMAEYRDRQPTPEPAGLDRPEPRGREPCSPAAPASRHPSKRPRNEDEGEEALPPASSPGTVSKRPKIMLRFRNAANAPGGSSSGTEEDTSSSGAPSTPSPPHHREPIKLRLRMPSKPMRPKLTLRVPTRPTRPRLTLNMPRAGKTITLKLTLPANPRCQLASQRSRPSQVVGVRTAQSIQGPMTRSRLRQLQNELRYSGPMTRSRLTQLRVDATRPGNRAKAELLASFLEHADGVSR